MVNPVTLPGDFSVKAHLQNSVWHSGISGIPPVTHLKINIPVTPGESPHL
jgi:hypothetical protein